MPDDDRISELWEGRKAGPSPWAVTLFIAACGFAAGALLLLILTWR